MTAAREYSSSVPPCNIPFYNGLGEEGCYYFNARWYDAGTGRFVSEDSARDGANWFTYVSNNPLKYIDPTGMWTFQLGVSFTGGAVYGGTTGFGIAISTDPQNPGNADIGFYTTDGVGSYVGGNLSVGIDVSTSMNDDLGDLAGDALTVGGSAGIPSAVYAGVSHEETYSTEDALPVSTTSAAFGLGSSYEVHALNTRTNVSNIGSVNYSGFTRAFERFVNKIDDIINGDRTPERSNQDDREPDIDDEPEVKEDGSGNVRGM